MTDSSLFRRHSAVSRCVGGITARRLALGNQAQLRCPIHRFFICERMIIALAQISRPLCRKRCRWGSERGSCRRASAATHPYWCRQVARFEGNRVWLARCLPPHSEYPSESVIGRSGCRDVTWRKGRLYEAQLDTRYDSGRFCFFFFFRVWVALLI